MAARRAAGRAALGREALTLLARLVVPFSVIATDDSHTDAPAKLPHEGWTAVDAYHRQMAAWFAREHLGEHGRGRHRAPRRPA